MRKAILTLCFVTLTLFNYAQTQVPREMVLVEIGTGTWCQYCPGAAMGADDLIENGHPVAIVENHNGDAYTNAYSNARNSYYGVPGYPTAYFDGRNASVGGNHTVSMYPNYLAKVNSRLNVPSSFLVNISGSNELNSYTVNVEIQKVADYQVENIVVHLALTESDIQVNWQGMTEVNFVNRLMVPSQTGTPITMATGETLIVPLTFTFNNSWVKGNCELVAWVQNNSTKEVMHSAKVLLNDLGNTMSANFTADVTSGCGPTEVHYENQSIGQNLTCTWVFPGGTPESSTEWNPVVTYSTEGLFDASLTITDGSESMSEMKEGFINIHTLPVVTISEIPVLCSFWDPVALTQGEPAGGVYSGNGVVDGFFYPQNVGAGSYEVTYTYTDAEFGCSNVATQLVVVDECTAIEEQVNGVALSILPNPTNGIFSINMSSATAKDVKVRVVNSLGKVVVDNVNLNVFGSTQQVIDLSGFARGVYFVQMESNGKTFNKKILVRD